MDLTTITDVEELISVSGVQKYLQAGWVLLNTLPVRMECEEDSHIVYSLGWPGEKGSVKRP